MSSLLVLLFAQTAARAQEARPCAAPVDDQTLLARADVAMQARARLDASALTEGTRATLSALDCLERPVSAPAAVKIHQISGLHMQIEDNGDVARARTAFASARLVDPDARLPVEIASPDVALYTDYTSIPLNTLVTIPLPEPSRGVLYVNGRPSNEIPATWPAIVQYADKSGQLTFSTYHMPREPIPFYPNRRSYKAPRTLGFVSVGVVAASTAFLVPASVAYFSYQEEDGSYNDYFNDKIRWRQRIGFPTLAVGGAGLIGAGIWATTVDGDLTVGLNGQW